MGEMDNLTLSGGRKRTTAPHRRGPIGALDRRQALRTSLRRSKRDLTRGVMRRIRGKGVRGDEEDELEGDSLILQTGSGDPYGDGDHQHQHHYHQHDEVESKPVTEIDSDDNDDFLSDDNDEDFVGAKEEHFDDSHDDDDDDEKDAQHAKKKDDNSPGGGHEKVRGDHASGSDSRGKQDHHVDEAENDDSGQWGRYDDEYENRSVDNDSINGDGAHYKDKGGGSYRDSADCQNGGGYKEGDHRQGFGSPRSSNGGRRNTVNLGRRSGLLKQLSKTFSPRSRRKSAPASNLDHTDLVPAGPSSLDPHWTPSSPPKAKIEGFGSTEPGFASPRTLRQKLKDFRENRIAARKDEEDGMKKMEVGGDPKKKNWVERIESVVDAMVDASITEPELQGYMTSSSLTIAAKPTRSSSTPTPPPTPAQASKMSYERKQFGDDDTYIVYLEGERVANELEVLSYKNRIKQLESEARKSKGIRGENDGDESDGGDGNTAPSDSSNASEGGTQQKESEIEWQTGVPEEGALTDLGGTDTAGDPNNEQSAAASVPVADLLQSQPEGQILETAPKTNAMITPKRMEPLPTPPTDLEIPAETTTDTTSEQTEGVLIELDVLEEAKDIVNNILADVLNESKVSSLLSDGVEMDLADALLSLKLEQSSEKADNITTEAEAIDPPRASPTDAPPGTSN